MKVNRKQMKGMGCLNFDKKELVNLEYALKREVLATNREGGYCSTTMVYCNTRKYHGLLILPVAEQGGDNYVLLSALDETLEHRGQTFNLGIHKYPGTYEPRGHKYIVDFEYDPIFSLIYRVGDIYLKKEIIMGHNEELILIRYTLLEAPGEVVVRLKPFLAYRRIHDLSQANLYVNTRFDPIADGIRSRMYEKFPALNMQLSRKNEFIPVPDWYYHVEYSEERLRGYPYQEDLYVPGAFEVSLGKGESVVFSASTQEQQPRQLEEKFQQLVRKRAPRDTFENCLRFSASQFVVRDGEDTNIVAGYPWFGRWGRDTFIALPGVTISASGDTDTCAAVLDTMVKQLYKGLFPNIGKPPFAAYNSVDAPLWFFRAVQLYAAAIDDPGQVWSRWGKYMKEILQAFRDEENPGIRMADNGLVWASQPGKALTWMDAIVQGEPVTPRAGFAVEINALWYNAVCYALELAAEAGETAFTDQWQIWPARIRESFVECFWYAEKGYLADYADEQGKNYWVRPNQVFACSLPYSPITADMKAGVLEVVRRELLTPWGLRTLSPKNPAYKGTYEGDQETRDRAYHQGTVWPWLMGAYIEAGLSLRGEQFLPEARGLMRAFREDLGIYGLDSIAEVYDGNPPHRPNGCISQAWSVGEILRSLELIKWYEEQRRL